MNKQKYLEPEITFLFTDDKLSLLTPIDSQENDGFDDSGWSKPVN